MSHMLFITSDLRENAESALDPENTATQTPYDHFKAKPLDRSEDGQLVQQAYM